MTASCFLVSLCCTCLMLHIFLFGCRDSMRPSSCIQGLLLLCNSILFSTSLMRSQELGNPTGADSQLCFFSNSHMAVARRC